MASEIAQKLKAFVTKPDDFSSLLRSHMVELTPTNCPLISSGPQWHTHSFFFHLKEVLMTVQTMVYVVGEHMGAAFVKKHDLIEKHQTLRLP